MKAQNQNVNGRLCTQGDQLPLTNDLGKDKTRQPSGEIKTRLRKRNQAKWYA